MKKRNPFSNRVRYSAQSPALFTSLSSAASHHQRSHSILQRVLIILTCSVFIILLIAPLLQLIVCAFGGGWRAAIAALWRPESLHALRVTAAVIVVVTVLNAIFGVWLSIIMVRGRWIHRAVRRLLNAIIDLPFAVSPIIGGFMIVLLLGPQTIIGTLFAEMGFQIVYAFPSMVLATLFVTFPLLIREVVPILQEIGTEQEEAASTLGAYDWTTFWKVTWPSIRWGVIYGIVLTIARSLGEFGSILVVSVSIMNKTQTATTLVYQDVENFNMVAASSLALVLVFSSIILLLIMEWAKRHAGRKGVH